MKSRFTLAVCAALAAGTLSACMGSGGSGEDGAYNAVASMPQTAAADMPTVGTATYSGHAGLDLWDEDVGDLDGDMNLTADFASGAVGGTISGLSGDTGAFNGSLDVQNATIAENTFSGEVHGEISRYSSEKGHAVGAAFDDRSKIVGEFRGDSADAVVGDFSGQAIHFEGDGPGRFEGAVDLKGGFVAEQ